MPTFICKVVTPQGQIIRSKIEDASKLSCIRRLKRNGMVPVSVRQTISLKRNDTAVQQQRNKKMVIYKDMLHNAKVKQENQKGSSIIEKLDKALMATESITMRDIRIFTQNFYLLKKANFNNIHALTTVIETTENPKLKFILTDILSGVESGDFMYTTMEYYSNVFPYIYINMIKVGELSGSLETSLQQAVKYLDAFLEEQFEGGRHQRRVDQIED